MKHHLKTRGINQEDCCDLCSQSESSGHILWGCKFASKVWGETRLKLPFIPNSLRDFTDIVWEIRERRPEID